MNNVNIFTDPDECKQFLANITEEKALIIISGSEKPEDKRTAENLGEKYFFPKPVHADALRVAILELLSD